MEKEECSTHFNWSENAKHSKNGERLKFTALVVDDNPFILEFLGDILKDEGIETLFAEDGRNALKMLAEMKDDIDIVITDIKMPEMNGIELSEEIHDKYPVIMMSGLGSEMYHNDQLNDLNDAFIEKFRIPMDLMDALNKAIFRFKSSHGTILEKLSKRSEKILESL